MTTGLVMGVIFGVFVGYAVATGFTPEGTLPNLDQSQALATCNETNRICFYEKLVLECRVGKARQLIPIELEHVQ
jgi:hypothetical protein